MSPYKVDGIFSAHDQAPHLYGVAVEAFLAFKYILPKKKCKENFVCACFGVYSLTSLILIFSHFFSIHNIQRLFLTSDIGIDTTHLIKKKKNEITFSCRRFSVFFPTLYYSISLFCCGRCWHMKDTEKQRKSLFRFSLLNLNDNWTCETIAVYPLIMECVMRF